ncbi:MAG: polyprenyl synthetase family protein [Sedimenticola sp.]
MKINSDTNESYQQTNIDKYVSQINTQVEKFIRKRLIRQHDERGALWLLEEKATRVRGKRVRPILITCIGETWGLSSINSLRIATAIEFIHIASCIVDDLPAFDGGDERDGELCFYKKYGEGRAILTAVGLLTDAFSLMSETTTGLENDMESKCLLIQLLSKCVHKMSLGQLEDICKPEIPIDTTLEKKIFERKTGALFEMAATAPVILQKGNCQDYSLMVQFGRSFGIAYQYADELEEIFEEGRSRNQRITTHINKHLIEAKGYLNRTGQNTSTLNTVLDWIIGRKVGSANWCTSISDC